jgi:hypothetical protein
MNAPHSLLLHSSSRTNDGHALLSVRSQAAFVRALLDEVERIVPPELSELEDAMNEQLVEELARLGTRLLAAASAFGGPLDMTPMHAVREHASGA